MKTFLGLILVLNVVFCSAESENLECLKLPDTLQQLHTGCAYSRDSRLSVCVAAAYRYCQNVKYPFFDNIQTFGVMRGIRSNPDQIDISCLQYTLKGQIGVNTFTPLSDGKLCDSYLKAQKAPCLEAVHNYCQDSKGGKQAGLIVEVDTKMKQFVFVCFETPKSIDVVKLEHLQGYNKRCQASDTASADCFNAACKWCEKQGHSGGITQGNVLRSGKLVRVACYNDTFHTFVTAPNPTKSRNDYYYERFLTAKAEWESIKKAKEAAESDDDENRVGKFRGEIEEED